MVTELGQQVALLQTIIAVLVVLITLVCCAWLAEDKVNASRKKPADDPTCPLHRVPRSKCRPDSHDD